MNEHSFIYLYSAMIYVKFIEGSIFIKFNLN